MKDLENAKPGDYVILNSRWHGQSISTVESITPAGYIKTKDGDLFKPNGCKRGGSWESPSAHIATIEEVTALRYKWKAIRLRKQIADKLDKCDYPSLLKIQAIIDAAEGAKP